MQSASNKIALMSISYSNMTLLFERIKKKKEEGFVSSWLCLKFDTKKSEINSEDGAR